MRRAAAASLAGLALCAGARAAEPAPPDAPARCAHYERARQPLFGDLHVHTSFSLDAAGSGTPRSAYEYARGRARPLDFAAVTDHAEWLGEVRICTDPEHPQYRSDVCWYYRAERPPAIGMITAKTMARRERFEFCGPGAERCRQAARGVWHEIRAAAEAFYDRRPECAFTTFAAYEWTGSPGHGINLHRNVVFAGAAVPELPVSFVEAPSPQALWDSLAADCRAAEGCAAIAIPHNSNLSQGLMFATARLEKPGDASLPIGRAEAEARQRFEPLIEIMQHKGDSECLPGGDTRDEACGFEKLPYDSFQGAMTGPEAWPGMPARRSDTVREALKRGLLLEAALGANPFRYGVLASTDTHTAQPGSADEVGYAGHTSTNTGRMKGALPDVLQYNPGGLAVVWAEQNRRESIFAALLRREVYGTSGPRIVARFFGGWGFEGDPCAAADFAERGYAQGVPMGAQLPARPADPRAAPVFALHALRDGGTEGRPGTLLREVQIVKGWAEAGAAHERVYTVASAAGSASVDPLSCAQSGPGAAALCEVWRDPDFDAREPAFYYARVLENPSCRWSQLVCRQRGVDCRRPETVAPGLEPCCHPLHQPVIQERAWTSPIWYSPEPRAAEPAAAAR